MNWFTKWSRLFIRWSKMMSGETQWIGSTDDEGVPVSTLVNGRKVYFATTVVQKALGHWDEWLLEGQERDKKEFLELTRWLVSKQDEDGKWPVWRELNLLLSSLYLAMTQGECISAFVRAWKITRDDTYARGARQALALMCTSIEEGGTAIYEGKEIFLEEAPSNPRVSILNGWIFALFGLYDFWLALGDRETYRLFEQSLNTLLVHLGAYDAGYWSYYDVEKRLARPFYHDLHIHQLEALAVVESDPTLTQVLGRWEAYEDSKLNRFRALTVKALQKLREPGEAVVIE